jgi:hypothetical protein
MEEGRDLLAEIVDFVLPMLAPYETSIYLYLLRRSHLAEPSAAEVRVGKRTIGEGVGKSARSSRSSYANITEKLENLAALGFVTIGDTNRIGTLYTVRLPGEVPTVREAMVSASIATTTSNPYEDADLRAQLFERDGWVCRYCGEALDSDTATLDHVVPVSKGGPDSAENLATACLMCNSIKSGRTLDEVAPLILQRVQRQRATQTAQATRDVGE